MNYGRIVAIDPGRDTGWAVTTLSSIRGLGKCHLRHVGGILLQSCGLTTPARYGVDLPGLSGVSTLVVVEFPQDYPGETAAKKADIAKLRDRARLALSNYGSAGEYIRKVAPHDWKGSVPKEIHNARILAALTQEERALVPSAGGKPDHNVVDAIGLSMWAWKKFR